MLSLTRRLHRSLPCLHSAPLLHFHSNRTDASGSSPPARRRPKFSSAKMRKVDDKSEWWAVDGEMHEIGENVPPRERFVIPRDNIPNKRRKQLREQFMRRTRLVLKESVSSFSPLRVLGYVYLFNLILFDSNAPICLCNFYTSQSSFILLHR